MLFCSRVDRVGRPISARKAHRKFTLSSISRLVSSRLDLYLFIYISTRISLSSAVHFSTVQYSHSGIGPSAQLRDYSPRISSRDVMRCDAM